MKLVISLQVCVLELLAVGVNCLCFHIIYQYLVVVWGILLVVVCGLIHPHLRGRMHLVYNKHDEHSIRNVLTTYITTPGTINVETAALLFVVAAA